ncbi:MAG: hypothetical protein Q8N18_11315 [Opitutaceae bacterium]|nr:hypothetical protein [Opitutaceae bacterium]
MSTSLNPLGFARSRLSALWLALFVVVASAHATSRWATLEAIHHLENPFNLSRPGAQGELGAYQFKRTTWQMHTRVPFAHALDRSVSDAIAVQHYEWLKRGLENAGRPATPYYIALAWNSGLGAATRGRAPRVAHDYAERATNLALEFERNSTRRFADVR